MPTGLSDLAREGWAQPHLCPSGIPGLEWEAASWRMPGSEAVLVSARPSALPLLSTVIRPEDLLEVKHLGTRPALREAPRGCHAVPSFTVSWERLAQWLPQGPSCATWK